MIRSSREVKPSGMQGSILARLRRDRGANPPAEKPPGRSRRRVWRWVVLLILSAAAMFWLLQRWRDMQFEWKAFATSFLSLDWRWAAGSIVLSLLTYYGRALRWRVMLRPLVPHPSRWRLFSATAIGFTAVVLLGRPGELVRPYLIATKEKVPFSSQLAAWFLERICDLLAVLVVFGVALTQLDPARARVGPALRWILETGGWALGVLGAACLLVLVMLRWFSDTMRRRILDGLSFLPEAHHRRLGRIITGFIDGASAAKTRASVIWLFLYTVLEWVLVTLCFAFLMRAYPATAGFALRDVLVFMGFVAFGSIFQIPGVGGGVQVVAILVLTQMYGLRMEMATSIAVMLWCITFVGIVPIGLALAFHEGLSWKRLRQLEETAAAEASAVSAEVDEAGANTTI